MEVVIGQLFVLLVFVAVTAAVFVALDVLLTVWFDEDMRPKRDR